MTIDFTNSNDLVETVYNDYDEDPSLSKVILDDDLFTGCWNVELCFGLQREAAEIGALEDALWSQRVPRNLCTANQPRRLHVRLAVVTSNKEEGSYLKVRSCGAQQASERTSLG